jgi:hypothetical protein
MEHRGPIGDPEATTLNFRKADAESERGKVGLLVPGQDVFHQALSEHLDGLSPCGGHHGLGVTSAGETNELFVWASPSGSFREIHGVFTGIAGVDHLGQRCEELWLKTDGVATDPHD